MRAGGSKRGLVSISLAFALAFSITFLATPVLAEAVISEPGGTTIEVEQGQEFVLSFRLEWDEPDAGFFAISLKWLCPENNPAENFTIDNVSAYFDNDQTINAAVTSETESPSENGTLYVKVIGTPAGENTNGQFDVDITILAGSEGFPHIPTNNHPIEIDGSILVAEALPWLDYYPPDPVITVRVPVRRSAAVSILPSYQSGLPGANLSYTVTVTNTGNATDNYVLEASDDAGWSPTVLPSSLVIPDGENGIATLSVTVPTDAIGCTNDNITVTATSTENALASAENTCLAHATIVRGVDVSISPTSGSAQPESDILYTVTVANTGNAEDTFDLTPSDNAGWSLDVTPGSLTVPPFENRTTTLSVTVPSSTPYCTEDNITVTATSRENTEVSDNASCIGHAAVLRRVGVVISPVRLSAMPGGTLSYTVTVTNTGNVWDNYSLAASDTAGWSPTVSPPTMALAMGQSDNATLSVTVADVAPCTEDNVTVTATSSENAEVSDNDSCIAHRVKAEFSLTTLYKVTLDLDFYLHTSAMIVAKFYTYADAYDNESIAWSGTTPTQVTISENIPHPENKAVKKVRLDLTTDNTENVIATIGSFVVRRDDLFGRIMAIKGRWPYASPDERDNLFQEIMDIKGQWPIAPS